MELRKTACCALSQICYVDNKTKLSRLKEIIQYKRMQAINDEHDAYSYGVGETALFVITKPNEQILVKRLIKVGFTKLHTFQRRGCTIRKEEEVNGRPVEERELTMWTINLI